MFVRSGVGAVVSGYNVDLLPSQDLLARWSVSQGSVKKQDSLCFRNLVVKCP